MLTHRHILSYICCFLGLFLLPKTHRANNILVSNMSVMGRDVSAGSDNAANFSLVQFDLTWNNSWRSTSPNNWDAAWVFVKFRLGSLDYLSVAGATSSTTSGVTTIQLPAHGTTSGLRKGMPVFIHSGAGSASLPSSVTIDSINPSGKWFRLTGGAMSGTLGAHAVIRAERIWEHCWLNNTGHSKGSIGSAASIQIGLQNENAGFHASNNPAMGVYFYRAAIGTGNFTTSGARLRWNYGAQGIKDDDIIDLKVSAVEMVYVPTDPYSVDTSRIVINTSLLIDGDGTNFANNNTFIDGSSNNYTITRFGNTAQGNFSPFCGTGGSAFFDGNGDYLTATAPNLNGSWTVECWWYPTAGVATQQTIISFNNGASSGINIWCNTSGRLVVDDGVNGQSAFTGASFTPNAWNHLVVVRSGTNTSGFINGVLAGNNTFTPGTTNSISVGRYNSSPFHYLRGFLSNVRLVNGSALYSSNFTPSSSPLTAIAGTQLLLRFENAAIDDTRRLFNPETADNAKISTSQVKFGTGSVWLDGSADYVDIPFQNDILFGTGDFTIEGWFYSLDNSLNKTLFEYGLYTQTTGGILLRNGASNADLWINNVRYTWSTADLPTNTWVHVALVRRGTNLWLFANGVAKITQTISASLAMNGDPAYRLRMGSPNFTTLQDWNGYVDDFRITKGRALYTANFTPPTSAFSLSAGNGSFTINSESALTLGGSAVGNLAYNSLNPAVDDFSAASTRPLDAAFPKGFNGFYCMKYEVTQQQWVNFFNSLTSIQKTARDITGATAPAGGKGADGMVYRNNINWTTGNATLNNGTHGTVACNYLNWPDAAAYADWAGLRPMTELEFEKAARGTVTPVTGESASGSVCFAGIPDVLPSSGTVNDGAFDESSLNATANAVYGNQLGLQGPLRAGALATATTTRVSAGASFYGIMDLSGNVNEQVVTIANTNGRGFTGLHGNGTLDVNGFANVVNWPGLVSGAVTGASGSGRRGGSWEDVAARLMVSDRSLMNAGVSARDRNTGFRAVRSMPLTAPE